MYPSSCFYFLLLVAHASSYLSSRIEEPDSLDDCANWCSCNTGSSYCCPTGEPDPDQCTVDGTYAIEEQPDTRTVYSRDVDVRHTHTYNWDQHCCDYYQPPRVIRCRETSAKLDVRRKLCSTRVGSTLVACRNSNRYVNSNCQYTAGCQPCHYVNCQYTGSCYNTASCCEQSPSPSGPLSYPPRVDLQDAVLNAARQSYPTRTLFVRQIQHILTNQASYSWYGSYNYVQPDRTEFETDLYNIVAEGTNVVQASKSETTSSKPTTNDTPEEIRTTTSSSAFDW